MPDEREPGGRAGAPTVYDEGLLTLLLRGALAPDDLKSAFPDSSGALEAVSAYLAREGLVEVRDGGRLALTATGRARGEAVLAVERGTLAAEASAIDGAFARLNRRVKQTVTAWQVRRVGMVDVPNDHGDPRHDAEVVADLCVAVDEAVALLEPLARRRLRFAGHRDRLARATARVRGGDRAFVSGLTVDSIHAIWWQLHAELLALLGRARGADDQ